MMEKKRYVNKEALTREESDFYITKEEYEKLKEAKNAKYCQNCGTKNAESAKFCGECGGAGIC